MVTVADNLKLDVMIRPEKLNFFTSLLLCFFASLPFFASLLLSSFASLLEHTTLALLTPHSTDYWYTNVLQIKIFKLLICANYLKTENNTHKKWNLVCMSLEHMILALLAPRSTVHVLDK